MKSSLLATFHEKGAKLQKKTTHTGCAPSRLDILHGRVKQKAPGTETLFDLALVCDIQCTTTDSP
jgi:hypothetical protein